MKGQDDIIKKLARVQSRIGGIGFDGFNPFHKSRYASMKAILEILKPLLAEENLFVTQGAENEGDRWWVETVVHDAGENCGEHMSLGKVPIMSNTTDMQKIGASITYARRFGLSAAFCLWAEEDNDGETTVGRSGEFVPYQGSKPAQAPVQPRAPRHSPVKEHDMATAVAIVAPAQEAPQHPAMTEPVTMSNTTEMPVGNRFNYKDNDHRKMMVSSLKVANIPVSLITKVRQAFENGYAEKNHVVADVNDIARHMTIISQS